MDRGEVLRKAVWISLALSGAAMILISGKLVPWIEVGLPGRTAEFLLRSGFGVMLIGILSLFLFSGRWVPGELVDPIVLDHDRNIGRLVGAMELKGNGIYIPAGGRLKEERVYVPAEDKKLPLPRLIAEQVLIVGTTGPSMGISMVPPGSGLVDRIERDTGRKFAGEELADLPEALERLSKGSGLIRSISARVKGDRIFLEIVHSRFREVCEESWKMDPMFHARIGCPGCSAVLSAAARVSKSPLRIESVEHKGGKVTYELERW
ncbi:MAG: hypothetical protein JW939_07510 [Candidatus Thermoplasmatota archaeon]|nr:hypothetical protein [Candidatus Thermoplasmatota archaeon]